MCDGDTTTLCVVPRFFVFDCIVVWDVWDVGGYHWDHRLLMEAYPRALIYADHAHEAFSFSSFASQAQVNALPTSALYA